MKGRRQIEAIAEFNADFEKQYCAARDLGFSRSLNPQLQTFAQWLAANKEQIPLG